MSDNELYDIIKVPDPVLKQVANTIENIDADVQHQAKVMLNTMYESAGIGLAANQVAKLNSIFVMDLPEGTWQYVGESDGVMMTESAGSDELVPAPKIFINPEVVWESEQRSAYDEGCLSIPGQYGEVIRPTKVRVKYQDLSGDTLEEEFEGLHSHCVQHEIDHLNGKLFIDYLSSLKRNMILRRMKKLQKETKSL